MSMTIEETISYFRNKYKLCYGNNDDEILEICMRKNLCLAEKINNNIIKQLETFCDKHVNLLKINECQIPLKDIFGKLFDIKLKTNHNISDDHIYKTNNNIQRYIPRGMTILKLDNGFQDICIYANKKFDDNNQYFLSSEENTKIISTEKLNGEALHFSCRYISDNFYLFVGSKTTHIVIQNENDINLYIDDKYKFAKKCAKMVYNTLENIPPENKKALLNLLHYTKITVVCEFLQHDYQHIVDIGDTDKLIFLTFTSTYGNDKSLTAFPPHIILNIINLLKLTQASYTIINNSNKNSYISTIKNNINSEGKVLYFLNNENETIGMMKVKTSWYICLRALREKAIYYLRSVKNNKEIDINESIEEKYNSIQEFANLTDEEIYYWKETAKNFIVWVDKNRKPVADFRASFPKIWKNFIN